MSNLVEYAKSELNRAFPDTTDGMQQLAIKDILELIETFSDQNHSGMSAPYVLRYFNRLAHWKPIGPLTGEENEWGEPYGSKSTQQNLRCSHVFRDYCDNSFAYDIEGKMFVQKDGISYTGKDSVIPVKFPYEVPDEPEHIYVEEELNE